MLRLQSICLAAAALASCVVFTGVSHSDGPATPWGKSAGSEASVADWANTEFASIAPPAATDRYGTVSPPNKLSVAPAPFPAPAGDRYGSSPAPARLSRVPSGPLPQGNPLRGPADSSIRIETPAASQPAQAVAAFAQPLPTAPVPSQPVVEAPRRISVAAVAPIETPPTPVERIVINPPVESPAVAAPPEPTAWQAEPNAFVEQASTPAPRREPIRVAAVAIEEPGAFEPASALEPASQSDFQPNNTFNEGPREGAGRPGSSDLEGPQEASLVLEKRGPSEARIGQPCRFAVRVRNTGRAAAENVILTDQVPAGATLISTTPTATAQGGKLTWRLGAIASGEERTVEMKLEPVREGPLGSVARVSMDAAVSASTVATRPQLAVRMTAPPRVLIGETQVVSIEVHNPGTGSATNVMLTEDIPSAVRHPAGSELEFEVGTLEPGETRRIELKLEAAEAGRVVNAVAVVGDGDLRAEEAVEFEIVAPSLAVSIDGPKRRYLERPASYTIGVDNPGTAPAKDVRLVTKLPRGMEFVKANNLGEYDATTHSVYWSLAELPEGERGEVKVVAVPVSAGEHTLKVQSKAASGLEAEQAHRVSVDGVASLAFEVRDLQDPIEVGDDTIYEVRVLNEGTKAATGVIVRVEAPSGMRIAAAQGQTGARTSATRAEFAPLARLEPGEKAAYRVKIIGGEAGDQRVTVLVESDGLDRPIRREESTRVYGNE